MSPVLTPARSDGRPPPVCWPAVALVVLAALAAAGFLDVLRDASVALCFGAAVILIGQAVLRKTRWRCATSEDQG